MSEKKCPKALLIQELLDSCDDKRLESELQEHLERCPECRREFAAYQNLFRSLDSSLKPPLAQPSPSQLKKIREAIPTKERDEKKIQTDFLNTILRWFFRPAFAFAIVALFALTAMVLFHGRNRVDPVSLPSDAGVASVFNLAENRVEVVFNSQGECITVDGERKNPGEVVSFVAGKTYELARDSVLMMYSGESRVKISDSAKFRINSQTFELFRGQADLRLAGKHESFKLITDLAEISVLGTEFSVRAGREHLFVNLEQGKILVKTVNGSVMQLHQSGAACQIDEKGNFVDSAGSVAENSGKFPHRDNPSPGIRQNGHSGQNLENSF